jgi:transketolase
MTVADVLAEDMDASRENRRQLRRDIVQALYDTGGGHYGGCLSVVDILSVLYREVARVNPRQPLDPERDRVVLSKGHAALALYAVLRSEGYFRWPLSDYAQYGSPLEGHPDMTTLPGVDFSTGSLGQGLSAGVGMALGLRGQPARTWMVLGDGECQEGHVWEAAMLAWTCRLGRLVAIVDCNGHQEWGHARDDGQVPGEPVPEMAAKWAAFGWRVVACDGHDPVALRSTLSAAGRSDHQPCVVLARTTKGCGVPMIEAQPQRFHCETVSAAEHHNILQALESV